MIAKQAFLPADIRKLEFTLADAFFNLAKQNWVRGGNLGMARQRALEQIDSFIASKDPNNPIVIELRRIIFLHRASWAKSIMFSQKSGDTIGLPTTKINKTKSWGAAEATAAFEKLNAQIEAAQEKPKDLNKNNNAFPKQEYARAAKLLEQRQDNLAAVKNTESLFSAAPTDDDKKETPEQKREAAFTNPKIGGAATPEQKREMVFSHPQFGNMTPDQIRAFLIKYHMEEQRQRSMK